MKKFLCFLLAILMLPAAAFADADLSAMSVDELRQLRDAVSLELASRCQADGALASWDSTFAHVDLLSIRRGVTDDGTPGVALVFAYTNTSEDVDTFRSHHWVTLYHDGAECATVIRLDGELGNNETWGFKVLPGRTLKTMQWFFVLSGTENVVDVEIVDREVPSKSAGIITVALPDE